MSEIGIALAGGTLLVTSIGFTTALLLTLTARRYRAGKATIVDLVNRELPQTQCGQCGYPGCRPYADAIVNGEAINKCPPGGEATIARLANMLGRPLEPLDPSLAESDPDRVAIIAEEDCIGCTFCMQACPVDAIIGTHQMMHTVIESECTGCELCVEPCPVDCIEMRPVNQQPDPVPLSRPEEMPCIQCDRCEEVCPRELKPQLLHWYLDSPERLQSLDVAACIECGRCDNVCPSHIPLAARFGNAKKELEQMAAGARRAVRLEEKYLRKQARQQRQAERIRKPPDKSGRAALIDAIKREVSH